MRLTTWVAIGAPMLFACSGSVVEEAKRDGGADSTPPPQVDAGAPPVHRPTATPCSTTRPPGVNDPDGGEFPEFGKGCCTTDMQCPETIDGGTNGRCTPTDDPPAEGCPTCTYDSCSEDSECANGGVCVCGAGGEVGREPNSCVPANCRVDSDCGPGGYCSPAGYPCSSGILGYYCHTPTNGCLSDTECGNDGGMQACEWNGDAGKWVCTYYGCPG